MGICPLSKRLTKIDNQRSNFVPWVKGGYAMLELQTELVQYIC